MKKTFQLLLIPLIILTMMACEFAGVNIDLFGDGGGDSGGTSSGGSASAGPVEAGVDSPSSGSTLQLAPVTIAYHASSTDGVAMVELSINGQVVNSFSSPASDQEVVALQYTWNPTAGGSYTIRVRAQSSTGAWSDYADSLVTIQGGQQQPQQPEQPQQPAAEATKTTEPTKTVEPTPDKLAVYDVTHDKDKFYYGGGGCVREVTISAKVSKPDDVKVVVLFIRFFDLEGGGTSKWDSGRAMVKKSSDTYSITLFSEKIPNYNMYEFAAMNYQIVVQDKSGNTRAAVSEVFKDIELNICQ